LSANAGWVGSPRWWAIRPSTRLRTSGRASLRGRRAGHRWAIRTALVRSEGLLGRLGRGDLGAVSLGVIDETCTV
jgi:hypothetical protein